MHELSLREAQKALTRERIQNAARELFYTSGYSAVTIEQIAAAAGTRRSTLYTHFRDKEDILDAIGQQYAAELIELIQRLPGPRPTRTQIEAWMAQMAHFVASKPAPTILFSSLGLMVDVPQPLEGLGDRLFVALSQQLAVLKPASRSKRSQALARERARAILRQLVAACVKQARASSSAEETAAAFQVTGDMIEFFMQAP